MNTVLFLFAKNVDNQGCKVRAKAKIRNQVTKMYVKKANREDPDQTASSEAVWSGFALFICAK